MLVILTSSEKMWEEEHGLEPGSGVCWSHCRQATIMYLITVQQLSSPSVYDCPGTNPSGSQPLPSADRLLDVSFIDFITLQLELLIVSQMPLTFVAEKQHSNKIETMTLNVHKKRVISLTIRGW